MISTGNENCTKCWRVFFTLSNKCFWWTMLHFGLRRTSTQIRTCQTETITDKMEPQQFTKSKISKNCKSRSKILVNLKIKSEEKKTKIKTDYTRTARATRSRRTERENQNEDGGGWSHFYGVDELQCGGGCDLCCGTAVAGRLWCRLVPWNEKRNK